MASNTLVRSTRVFLRTRRLPAGTRLAPMPAGADWFLGHLRLARHDAPGFLLRSTQQCGDVVRFRFGPMMAHLLARPEHVQFVLADHHRAFSKQARGFEKLRPVLGNGLLNSEGEFWLRQRRTIQPMFDRRALPQYGRIMAAAAADLAAEWDGRRGQTLDVAAEMMRLALKIVGLTLLDTDVTAGAGEVGEALTWLMHETQARIFSIFDLREKLPGGHNRKYRQKLAVLDVAVLRIIRERRAHPGGHDLVAQLLRAQDEQGNRMSDRQVRDEVMTIFLAGHETTANLLSWTWMLLALHPQAERRLRSELDGVLGGRAPDPSDCDALDYTRRVLQESLRLYPPAWFIPRAVLEDVTLDGYYLPQDSVVMLSPYVTHRLPQHWPDPERFDPDRFLPQQVEERHKWAYFPFGGGPRLCIGNHFAILEATLIVATLAQRFRLRLAGDQPVEHEALITLRPKGKLVMQLE
ncbi:MAG: cytochrome P450 [Planctomycetota bacterium]|nr:MAG: cytochrome P450 [Planctomycetota bacterium]